MSKQFNQKYLEQLIEYHIRLLNRKDLSNKEKRLVCENVYKLNEYFDIVSRNNNDDYEDNASKRKNCKLLIKDIITKAKNDYMYLDKRIINFIIYMKDNHVHLNSINAKDLNCLEENSIIDLSLDIYKKFLPHFYQSALKIINNPRQIIHFNQNEVIGSECYFNEVVRLPFIYVEGLDRNPSAFIHELQHGIEGSRRYSSLECYAETIPILLETLFIDKICEEKNMEYSSIYRERIEDIEDKLELLSNYFKFILELKENSFTVSNKKCLEVLYKYELFFNASFELEAVLDIDVECNLTYILSFLKSLELRNKLYLDKKVGLKHVRRVLMGIENIDLKDKQRILKQYNSYINEINDKCKVKKI